MTVEVDKNMWLGQAAQAVEQADTPPVLDDQLREVVTQYFRHVDPDELARIPAERAGALLAEHLRIGQTLPDAEGTPVIGAVESGTPGMGRVVIQLVITDEPFLVDTVTMEVLRQGWAMVDIQHPQLVVRRDQHGAMQRVLPTASAYTEAGAARESWIHLEVDPPVGADFEDARDRLITGLGAVIQGVNEAVQDWPAMRERINDTIRLLEAMPLPVDDRELAQTSEFLSWVDQDHFTLLGYREYTIDGDEYTEREGTGLGILRHPDRPDAFHAVPSRHPGLLVVTKDNFRSRIHRPAYLDYIGVRILDDDGTPVGERRFLGLFAAAAYSDSVGNIPLVRDRAREIVRRSGFESGSHGAKAIWSALETYPRDELFQSDDAALARTVEEIARLKERRQVRLFVRADASDRYLSCLVFLPRDRYTTRIRNVIENMLLTELGGESVDYQARVTESVLARLHFTVRMPEGHQVGSVDVPALEDRLTVATQNWDDHLAAALEDQPDQELASVWAGARGIPEAYKEAFDVRHALMDLNALGETSADDISLALYVPDDPSDSDVRLKVFAHERMTLTEVLPHLAHMGVTVVDERPYDLTGESGTPSLVYDFGLRIPEGVEDVSRWSANDRDRFQNAFRASWQGDSEADGLNRLVMAAGLDWTQVAWLRAISRYLQQARTPYSQKYIADSLLANVPLVRRVVGLFAAKFDPDAFSDAEERGAVVEQYRHALLADLEVVDSLDHDRIIRSFLSVIDATVRTNAFRDDAQALALKILPTELEMLPEPRPAFEVFVCSPRVEGVHLRFGSVARGGLRWSDRREDFRTEVLGLVKAQMVKNTVIVPVGAKGGFLPKQLPDRRDREAWFAEGRDCYRVFINSLLDVSDNIIGGEIDPPTRVVRFDDDDPYMVVAADKGTATFSDVANEISVSRGFWLGDAFASGGSVGYDHKGMGITARGAWESVKRHFREMGVDCQNEDFTCVGIGDMSGDVFGNGMLLSRHIRLVAAFNHMHIFLDPDPDAAASWEERRRLFDTPRSTWDDYDRSLISAGGGVHSRRAKSIAISPEVRGVLGLDDHVTSMTPTELIRAILCAPVDLVWNGGIGTYVKAASETHAQVGDKANDPVRVNGGELRARAVGEGGNLGFTQLGRIEYARNGGRINTDFIDNSAGVDTSDHEVNIKILLAQEVAAGRLSAEDRAELLASMTDEVAELVLANNYDQNLALANGLAQAVSVAPVHERWMCVLEEAGLLDRGLENLPTSAEMEHRIRNGEGLTAPELATLLAYTKIHLENEVIASDLPDDPYFADRLARYFPPRLRESHSDIMRDHRLQREIIATVTVNRFVNSSGITSYYRLNDELGASPVEVIRAHLAARAIFRLGLHEEQTAALDNKIPADVQTSMRIQFRNLVERGTRWVLANRRSPVDVGAVVEELADDVARIKESISELQVGRGKERFDSMCARYTDAGVDQELATVVATAQVTYQSLDIATNAQRLGVDVIDVAAVHFQLAEETGIDLLRTHIGALPRTDRWETMARSAMREDLHQLQSRLTAQAMSCGGPDASPSERVAAWAAQLPEIAATEQTLSEVVAAEPEIARISVGLRSLRALLDKE